ncbi:MAG: arginine--tRNA ligase, partial [Sedimentisphaerales bacterium]
MKPTIDILEERISTAMAAATGRDDCAAIVRPSTDPKFGDYQANGIMPLAKKLKTDPCKLAELVVQNLDISDICEPPKVAGPGFINLRLKPEFLADRLLEINKEIAILGIDKTAEPKTIVVDFSSPNIAKQMHVGHLRSTIIGDCICNVLEFLGHKVIRQNHIGDWGTQFGMLCALYERKRDEEIKRGEKVFPYMPLADLEAFYKEAKQLFDTDQDFARDAREAIAGLHSGNQIWLARWREIIRASKEHYEQIYKDLKVRLYDHHIRGESEYKNDLPNVIIDLKKNKWAKESDGAVCVFPPGFKNKEGQPLPFIIQKSDGAYLYATTDLAALRYRVDELKANAIIYVTDARQKLHFEMLFAVAKMAGWVSDDIELSHVMFGSILGDDGTPLKTRAGENVKLKELLDEAVERAKAVVEEKNPELSQDKKEQIAKAVGIGAVKYADYSNNRTSDYVFSFDKMLAMDGNTAPYMQYAYARIKSIERKAQTKDVDIEDELA